MWSVGCTSVEMFLENPLSCGHSEADPLDKVCDQIPCLQRISGLETHLSPEPFPQRHWASTVHGDRDGGAWSTVHLEMLTFEAQKQTSTSEPCSPVSTQEARDAESSGSNAVPSSVHLCGQSPTEIKSSAFLQSCGDPSDFLHL